MNREQGYKLIELVFIANEKFVMHRCRFSFTALDKSVISYLNISTSKEWRLFIAFLKSDYGRIVVLDHIDRFLNAYGSYALIQRIWKIVTKTPVDLVEATIASERYRDPIFYSLSTLFAYQDKFEDLDKLSTAEIHKLAARVIHLAQKLYRMSNKNNKLFQVAIHSLGSEIAFDRKPWDVESDKLLLPLLRKLEELKAHNEQIYKTVSFGNKQLNHLTEITQSISINEKRLSEQVEKLAHPLPDIFKIGIACNAFIHNPSTPSKYLIKGPMQTAFGRWLKALLSEGYDYNSLPLPSELNNTFMVSGKNYASEQDKDKSIRIAYEIAKSNI